MALDREKVSSRGAVRILAPAVAATGGDILKETFIHRTVHRTRVKVRSDEAAKIKSSFQKPELGTVHFDSKLILESGDSKKGDRIAVIVS